LLTGIAIGGFALNINMSWREVMVVNVIPGAFMAALIFWLLGRLQVGEAKQVDRGMAVGKAIKGFVGLLRNKTLMLLSVSSAFRSATQGALLVFVPLYLTNEMHYSPAVTGSVMMVLQLAGFLAAPIAGGMSDKMGRRSIMMSSILMTGVVLVFMVFAGGSPWFVFFVACLGFFLFAIRAVLQAWTLDATPKGSGGSAIGLLFGIQAIGGAIGPLVCGPIAESYGLVSTFYFMAASIVLANCFIFFIPKIEGQKD
jgi:predicted MFS family arabinose efflux permease